MVTGKGRGRLLSTLLREKRLKVDGSVHCCHRRSGEIGERCLSTLASEVRLEAGS